MIGKRHDAIDLSDWRGWFVLLATLSAPFLLLLLVFSLVRGCP